MKKSACQFNIVNRKLFILWLLFLSVNSSYGQFSSQMDKKSNLVFHIKSFGVNVEGGFQNYSIEVEIDTLSLINSHIKARIPIASIETGIDKRNRHLLEEKYFWENKYPNILFESVSIEQISKGSYVAEGLIIIKGVEKNISVPFQLKKESDQTDLISEFELNRLDFGVGTKSWIMSDIVKIAVSFTLKN